MLVERLTLWLARTNAWIVAPTGPGGECVVVDAPPDPSAILDRLAALDLRLVPRLFSGDHLFAGSIGRTDLPGGSLEQLMGSMVDKVLPLADDVEALPGHGPSTTIGRERATNPFLVGLDRPMPRSAGVPR